MSGKPVVNATEPLTIELTEADKADAVRMDNRNCVYARACQRLFGKELLSVEVNKTRLLLEFPDRFVRYRVRESVVRELIAFDRGGECELGVYQFGVPRKPRIGRKARQPGTRKNQQPMKATLPHVTGLMRRDLNAG